MRLQSWREVEVTREKLQMLEQRYALIVERPCDNEYVRDLTLRSFKKMINQLKEEIAVFESHAVLVPTSDR
jgi:hypothetical protein